MKAPAFMFYTGDFLSSPDVQLMEVHEVGAYCLLLFNSWQSDRPGYLPDDEHRIRRTARLTTEQWAVSRELLLSKFQPAARRPHPPPQPAPGARGCQAAAKARTPGRQRPQRRPARKAIAF